MEVIEECITREYQRGVWQCKDRLWKKKEEHGGMYLRKLVE